MDSSYGVIHRDRRSMSELSTQSEVARFPKTPKAVTARRSFFRERPEPHSFAFGAPDERLLHPLPDTNSITKLTTDFDPNTLGLARSDASFTTIVTGLPRSGTSLMMQMLARGGLPALQDDHRSADEDNPRGYFEFAPAKNIRFDSSWLPQTRGRALKLHAEFVPFLPPDRDYRVILMERSLDEVVSSQRVMLARKGAALNEKRLKDAYVRQLMLAMETMERLKISVQRVAHGGVLVNPGGISIQVAEFLGLPLDVWAMAEAVEPDLYRQRIRPQFRYRHE